MNKIKQAGFTLVKILSLVWLIVVAAIVIGWIMNIFDLVGMKFDEITIEIALRIVGIVVVPLGAIMGLFF